MQGIGDLRQVADAITRQLADGSLPAARETAPSVSGNARKSPSTLRPLSRAERLTPRQARRREAIKRMILRYQEEKSLDPLTDDDLFDTVRSYDEHFTHAGIPTARLKEVYLEAMAHHGQYLLRVDDYLRAWRRLRERELPGHELDARAGKPSRHDCRTCHGSGLVRRAVPKPGVPIWVDCDEVEVECVFCIPVVTSLATASAF